TTPTPSTYWWAAGRSSTRHDSQRPPEPSFRQARHTMAPTYARTVTIPPPALSCGGDGVTSTAPGFGTALSAVLSPEENPRGLEPRRCPPSNWPDTPPGQRSAPPSLLPDAAA